MTGQQGERRFAGAWQENVRCRACGHREERGYSPFLTLCPGCGATARWAWQLWNVVIERRVGWRRRWEQRGDGQAFEPDMPEQAGAFIG